MESLNFHKKLIKVSENEKLKLVEVLVSSTLDEIGDDLLNNLNLKETREQYMNKIEGAEISVFGVQDFHHKQFVYYCVLDRRDHNIKYIKGLNDRNAPQLIYNKLESFFKGEIKLNLAPKKIID